MENLFVECADQGRVVEALRSYRRAAETAEGWDSTPSYPTTLKVSPRRESFDASPDFPRHCVSRDAGTCAHFSWKWILVASRSDVVDLALARHLSRALDTCVIAVFARDMADTYGVRCYKRGEMTHEENHEMEERASYRVDQCLECMGVPFDACSYDECAGPGWRLVELDPGEA